MFAISLLGFALDDKNFNKVPFAACSIKGKKCSANLGDSLGTEHLLVMSMIGLVLLAA